MDFTLVYMYNYVKTEITQAESSFAQKLRNELFEIEIKLDRLLDLQLEGSLTQTEYTTKKQKLILAKKDLEEKISAFGRKSNNRFELAITFLKDTNQIATIVIWSLFFDFSSSIEIEILSVENQSGFTPKYSSSSYCSSVIFCQTAFLILFISSLRGILPTDDIFFKVAIFAIDFLKIGFLQGSDMCLIGHILL